MRHYVTPQAPTLTEDGRRHTVACRCFTCLHWRHLGTLPHVGCSRCDGCRRALDESRHVGRAVLVDSRIPEVTT